MSRRKPPKPSPVPAPEWPEMGPYVEPPAPQPAPEPISVQEPEAPVPLRMVIVHN